MLTWLADRIMSRRASRIVRRLRHHLPSAGSVADVGSGTGHNGEQLRRTTQLEVRVLDIEDLHWVGPIPDRIVAGRCCARDGSVDAALLLYVLQYPDDAVALLRETARITRGPILVLQSTYDGPFAMRVLAMREFCFGRFGFYLARSVGLISDCRCPLLPRRYFTRSELRSAFADAGLEVVAHQSESMPLLKLRRDLFVLGVQRDDAPPDSPVHHEHT